jgi:hypothetical protein
MGKRFTLTEEEKNRIKLLYEQEDDNQEVENNEVNLQSFLKDNFAEIPGRIGTFGLKTNDNSFVVDLTLEQDGNTVKYLKFVVSPEHTEFVNTLAQEKNIPIVKTSTGEMVTRAPFKDVEVLEKIYNKVKEINGDF